MLTQLQEGKVHLEDTDGNIELDLSACKTGTGLYTDNCFVLAEGTYTDGDVFRVDEMGLPPPERRSVTSSAFGHLDFLGTPGPIVDETILEQEEKANSDIAFVIISDVWLDQPKTMSSLRTIFEGYADALVPLAFILIGNFVSKPFLYSGTDSIKYKDSFNALADLILEFPTLATYSYFVFVPGSHDPWSGNTLPRPPIPDFFTGKLRNKVKKVCFTSNPCRVKYCTQEIVIFRDDILGKLRRNTLIPPNLEDEEEDITKHLIRTILDEGHLCPLPMHIRPIFWAYDHALRLYPMPHVLVLADRCENYGVTYEGSHCINPGSFPNSDFTWSIYYPATRRSERCALPPPR
ncbi:Pole2 protein [Jimgerdemannia flammicorona]|uniref:DNA polymerase epsilon subunit B n=1 Tax=Jimgerdemannia flammicorona TaxID=994334 RepID=A0A433QQ78_9FUNG|nr:Pole2 protein [Jimgerdemannia flammicorona]